MDYGSAAINNRSALPQTGASFFKSPVGTGYGVGFGVNATLFEKIHLAASVTNLGSITYTGNVYSIVDTLLIGYNQDGLDDLNIAEVPAEILEEAVLFEINGLQERKVNLPEQLRLGT